MPQLSESEVGKSILVSQMGIAPYITALDEGAQIILAGRSCDVAIFAADPVRRGLKDMVKVLRSKDAGVNTTTYDIFFRSEKEYRQALDSNAFTKRSVAGILGVSEEQIIGTFRADPCYAIKISRYREMISGVPGSPDGFGAQQHMKIELMQLPIYDS
jgi:hypothetical protein